jgi:opacity protein-like surface antigen
VTLARLDRSRIAVLALLAALAVPVAAQAVQPVDGGRYAAGTVIDLPCLPPPPVASDADEYEGGQISSSLRQADGQLLAACTRATDAVRILAVTQASPIVARLGPGTYYFGRASCGYRGYLLDGVWVDETFDGGQGVDKARLDCFHDFIPGGGQFEICAGALNSAGDCLTAPPPKTPWKQRLGLDSTTLTALGAYSKIARNETLLRGWTVVAVMVRVVNPGAGMLVGVAGALLAFSGSVAENIVNDPPDQQYTTLPDVKAVAMPRVQLGRRLKRAAVRRLNAYATHSGRQAALIAEILQGVERYGAATTAGDTRAALRQRSHLRANAATLAELLQSAAALRKRAARAVLGLVTGKRPQGTAWRKMLRRVHDDTLQRLTRAGVPPDRATAWLAPILSERRPHGRPTLRQLASPQLARAERDLAAQMRRLSTGR